MVHPTAALWGDIARENAKRFGTKVAFVDPTGRATSFHEFNARVNQLNHAVAGLGIGTRARVALLSRNRTEYVEALGLSKSGFVLVPMNWRLTQPELAYQFNHSLPEVVIVDEDHRAIVDALRPSLKSVRHFVTYGDAPDGWISYDSLLTGRPIDEPECLAWTTDTLCLMYTSGTTGLPKAVELTHQGLINNCRTMVDVLALNEDDITLAAMPFFHVGGMWYHLFPSFAAGATNIVRAEFDPEKVVQLISKKRVTNLHLVPTMIGSLLEVPGIQHADISSLRMMFYAASSIPAELLRRAMAAFGEKIFLQCYGSTECGVVAVLTPDDHLKALQPGAERLLTACGTPVHGCSVRVVDPMGQDVPADEVGEIVVKSAASMRGYWSDASATENAQSADWLKSGDLGCFDELGYLYIVDRKSDMIVTGGENVYPREVEDALFADPDVLEVAVFALPDPKWVERVAAAVRLRPGSATTSEDLIRRVRQRLAGYKCPKSVFIVDSLPKSGAGKILKKELRRQFNP